MHTRNFIFLFFRLLNLRGAAAPFAPPPPGYATGRAAALDINLGLGALSKGFVCLENKFSNLLK